MRSGNIGKDQKGFRGVELSYDLVNCHYCKKEMLKRNCRIVEAIRNGLNLYCDSKCSNLGRRVSPVLIRSKRIGVPNKLSDKQREKLKNKHAQGVKVKELIQLFGISRTSVYNYLK